MSIVLGKLASAGASGTCHHDQSCRAARQRRAYPRSRWRYGASGVDRRGEFIAHGTDYHHALDLVERVYGEGKVADAFWRYLEVRTSALIEEHWSTIERVAAALVEREILTRDDVAEICQLRRAGTSDAKIDAMVDREVKRRGAIPIPELDTD